MIHWVGVGGYLPLHTDFSGLKIMDTIIQKIFNSNYRFELLDEWPGVADSEKRFYFPFATLMGGKDGLMIRFYPHESNNWLGVFEFGGGVTTGVYTCPNPDQVCVVSQGNSYIVNVNNPRDYIFRNLGTSGVYQVHKRQLLILTECNGICALGKTGIIWHNTDITDPAAFSVTDDFMKGTCEDCGKSVPFTIDMATGKLIYIGKVN